MRSRANRAVFGSDATWPNILPAVDDLMTDAVDRGFVARPADRGKDAGRIPRAVIKILRRAVGVRTTIRVSCRKRPAQTFLSAFHHYEKSLANCFDDAFSF